MKIFATDLDGVLLDLDTSIANAYSDILGMEVKTTDLTTWEHSQALGVSPHTVSTMWNMVWLQYPAKKYPGANEFIDCLKTLGYETVVVTNRGSIDAAYACGRDLNQLKGLKDVIVMNKKIEPKSYYINRLGATWYIDDNIDYAVEAYLNCSLVEDVFLMTREHNTHCKDIVGYRRLNSYADVLQYLSQHPQ